MESAKRRSQRDYTLTFKLSVVDQLAKGTQSVPGCLPTQSVGAIMWPGPIRSALS
jgi:hypothetical protein